MLPLRQAGRRRRAALLAPPPSSPPASRPNAGLPSAGMCRQQSLLWAGIRARLLSTSPGHPGSTTAVTSLPARCVQTDIVNALRKGDRQRASTMLSSLKQTKEALTSEDFSCILDYCAKASDPLFVMEILEIMEEKAVDISKNNYRSVTRALTEGGYSKEWCEIRSKAAVQAVRIAADFPHMTMELAAYGLDEYIWTARTYLLFVKDLDGVFYEIWCRVNVDHQGFRDALKQVYAEKKFPARDRNMGFASAPKALLRMFQNIEPGS